MQIDHITMDIPSLIRFERGLQLEAGPRTSKISTFLYKSPLYDVYFSAAQKTAFMPASIYNYIAASPYSNTHSKFQ